MNAVVLPKYRERRAERRLALHIADASPSLRAEITARATTTADIDPSTSHAVAMAVGIVADRETRTVSLQVLRPFG